MSDPQQRCTAMGGFSNLCYRVHKSWLTARIEDERTTLARLHAHRWTAATLKADLSCCALITVAQMPRSSRHCATQHRGQEAMCVPKRLLAINRLGYAWNTDACPCNTSTSGG
eukprot:11198486-Lingulodinium_polyedra.AAC.1